MEPKVFDIEGVERDWAWVTQTYGSVYTRAEVSAGQQVYRLVEAIEREGAATEIVTVLDADGNPKAGVPVARFWPGAPEMAQRPASPWKNKGVIGKTNDRGDVGFGMGRGDYISSVGAGVSAVWVADTKIPCDLVDKLGMIAGTNHRRLDIVFQLQTESGETPPPPPSGDLEQRVAALESRLAEVSANLPTQETIDTLQQSLNAVQTQLTQIENALHTVRQALSNFDQ